MSASEKDLEKGVPSSVFSLNSENAVHLISLLAEQPDFDLNAINQEGNSWLHCAIAIDNIDVDLIKLLLKNGADVDLKDQNGRTPLMLALHLRKTAIAGIILEHIKSKSKILNLKEWKEFFIQDLEKGDLKSAKDKLRRIIKDHKEVISDFVHAECNGRSVLCYACIYLDSEFIRLLADNGVQLGNEQTVSESPLFWVITATRFNLIAGKEVDITEGKKCAALQALLDAGANLDFQDGSRELFEQCAIADNSPKVLDFLRKKRSGSEGLSSEKASKVSTVLTSSSSSASKSEVSLSGLTEIYNGVSNTDIERNEKLEILLHSAVKNRKIDIVALLLSTGRDVNIQDDTRNTALHYAVLNRDSAMVQVLLKNGAAMNISNNRGETPLTLSKKPGYEKINDLFLAHAQQCLGTTDANQTILDFLQSSRDRFKPLFENEHIPSKPSLTRNPTKDTKGKGKTKEKRNKGYLLHDAVRDDEVDSVKKLLAEEDIDINFPDEKGFRPLHYAVINQNTEIVRLLLDNNADIDARDKEGRTPIYYARDFGMASLLVEDYEARLDIVDKDGKSPADWARAVHAPEDICILLEQQEEDNDEKKRYEVMKSYGVGSLKDLVDKRRKDISEKGYKFGVGVFYEKEGAYKIEIAHRDSLKILTVYALMKRARSEDIGLEWVDGKIFLSFMEGVNPKVLMEMLNSFDSDRHNAMQKNLKKMLEKHSMSERDIFFIEPQYGASKKSFFNVFYHFDNKDAVESFKKYLEQFKAASKNPLYKEVKMEEKETGFILKIQYREDVLLNWKMCDAYCKLLSRERSSFSQSKMSASSGGSSGSTASPNPEPKPDTISGSKVFLISLGPSEELALTFKEQAKKEKTFILFKRGRLGYFLYRPRQDEEVVFLETPEEGFKIANDLRKNILGLRLVQREINFFDRIPHDRFRKGKIVEFTETDFRALSGSSRDLSFSAFLSKLDAEPSHLFQVNFRFDPEREEMSYSEFGHKKKKTNDRIKKKGRFFESEASLKPALLLEPPETKKKTSFVSASVIADKKDGWIEGPDGQFYPAGMVREEKSKKKEEKLEAPKKQKLSDDLLREEIRQMGVLMNEYHMAVKQENLFEQRMLPGAIYRSLIKALLLRMEVIQDKVSKASDNSAEKKLKLVHRSLSRLRNYLVHFFCLSHPWNEERVAFLLYLGEWVKDQFKFSKRSEQFDGVLNHISKHEMNIDDEECRKILLKVEETVFSDLEGLDLLPPEFLIEKLLKGLKYLDGLFKVLDDNPQALLPEDKKRKKYYYVACAAITMVVEYNNLLMKKEPKIIIPELQEMLYGANNKLRKPLVHEGNQDYNFNHNALLMVAGQLSSLIEFIDIKLKSKGASEYILDLREAQSLYPNPYVLFGSDSLEQEVARSSADPGVIGQFSSSKK